MGQSNYLNPGIELHYCNCSENVIYRYRLNCAFMISRLILNGYPKGELGRID